MIRVAQGDDLVARVHIADPTNDEGREDNYIDLTIKATDSVEGTPGNIVVTWSNATGITSPTSPLTINLSA